MKPPIDFTVSTNADDPVTHGAVLTRRPVPAQRSDVLHGCLAAPFLGLAFLRQPGACVPPGGKKVETQIHADKKG